MRNPKDDWLYAYNEDYQMPEWSTLRNRVLRRDGVRCVACGSDEGQLHAHHLYYLKGRRAWEYPLSALVTLCARCHEDIHAVPSMQLPWEQLLADQTKPALIGLAPLEQPPALPAPPPKLPPPSMLPPPPPAK